MNINRELRRKFFHEMWISAKVLWPIISGLFVMILGTGFAVSHLEHWGFGDGIYFAFVTALTIGYGDLVPTHLVSRLLSLSIGFTGIIMTALLAGASMRALQIAQAHIDEIALKRPAKQTGDAHGRQGKA